MCEQSIWPAQGSRTPDHIEKEHVTRTQSQEVYPESDVVPAEGLLGNTFVVPLVVFI